MNKKLLLLSLPVLSLLLSGCVQSSSKGKKTSSTDISSGDISSTDNTGESTAVSTDVSNSETLSSTSESSATDFLVSLCGSALPFDNYGVHIGDVDSEKGNRDKILGSLNTQVGKTVVSSISANNCHIQTDDGTANQEHLHFSVGSGGAYGYVEFTFYAPLKRVVVEASAYYKSGYTVDANSKIIINGIEHNFETIDKDPHPDVETFDITYSESSNKLRFANDDEDQRFFLDSLHLYF